MVEVEIAFFALSVIIFIGYFGLIFFKKTKISEILVLMLIGLMIGPLFGFIGEFELALFQGFLPFFASFTLMVILFEGGMHLNFFKTLKDLPGAFFFTVIVFISTVILVSGTWFLFTQNILEGLLVGVIIGGNSSAILIPLIKETTAEEETKSLIGLESALTDVLCVVFAVTIAEIMILFSTGVGEGINLALIGSSILSAFSIAAVLGGIIGFVWIKLLSFLENKPYEYLLTIAVLMCLYAVVEFFGANGAIAALIFGMVLGNSEDLTNMLKLTPRKVKENIKSFQMEITFIVRTFFFVYLGLLFKLEYLSDLWVILISVLLIIAIILARAIGSKILCKTKKLFKEDYLFLVTLGARGLAPASLISFPIIIAAFSSEAFGRITAIIFLVIFFSNIVTTIGVFIAEKTKLEKIKLKKIKVPETKTVQASN